MLGYKDTGTRTQFNIICGKDFEVRRGRVESDWWWEEVDGAANYELEVV